MPIGEERDVDTLDLPSHDGEHDEGYCPNTSGEEPFSLNLQLHAEQASKDVTQSP